MNLDELERIAKAAQGILDGTPDERFIAACSPDVVLALISRIRDLERGLRRACHAGSSIELAYEDSHREALHGEIAKAGALVGWRPGDPWPP